MTRGRKEGYEFLAFSSNSGGAFYVLLACWYGLPPGGRDGTVKLLEPSGRGRLRRHPAGAAPERLDVEPVEWQQDTRDALKECGEVILKRTARLLYACAPCRPGMTPSG